VHPEIFSFNFISFQKPGLSKKDIWLLNSCIQGEKLNGFFIPGGIMELGNHFGDHRGSGK
jgi:hypothetical protein